MVEILRISLKKRLWPTFSRRNFVFYTNLSLKVYLKILRFAQDDKYCLVVILSEACQGLRSTESEGCILV